MSQQGCKLSEVTEHRTDDILIGIMGKVGHGKTSFLHFLTNPDREAALSPTAANIIPSESTTVYRLHGWYEDRLVFFDTRGFESTSDLPDVIADVEEVMNNKLKRKKMAGIIYLYAFGHEDTGDMSTHLDPWFGEAPRRVDLKSMKNLCHKENNCIKFATCDRAWHSGQSREAQINEFTENRKTITGTATGDPTYVSFLGDQTSAREIVSSIATNFLEPTQARESKFLSKWVPKLFRRRN